MNPFRPVKSRKISERIVQQIKGAILRGAMKPGDRLPPERELVERFRASRISVREALKNLETSGLLHIKPGSGVFVAEVNSRPMSESLASMLRIKKVSMNELTEARMILEPNIARLACERMNPEDLQRLKGNIEEALAIIKSNVSARVKNIEFHSLLAESTRNAVLALTMKTVLDVLKDMSSGIVDNSPKNIEIASHTVRHHRKILKALKEKDAQKVYELMRKHIHQIQGSLKKAETDHQ
ncbi:MAG: FadR/GntR family transcriptional regulator [Thermodesulfobacteriota bacterium]|nr:FadR/GntR family transcriptional regulator [Thermodesulfobacteriota bacterium]